jgi:hypothetical protein
MNFVNNFVLLEIFDEVARKITIWELKMEEAS